MDELLLDLCKLNVHSYVDPEVGAVERPKFAPEPSLIISENEQKKTSRNGINQQFLLNTQSRIYLAVAKK